MTPSNPASAVVASLMPQHKAAAIKVAQVFASQPNLPAWLASLDGYPRAERSELLQRAAYVMRTDLPDRLAAEFLSELAENDGLLIHIIQALHAAPNAAMAPEAQHRVA